MKKISFLLIAMGMMASCSHAQQAPKANDASATAPTHKVIEISQDQFAELVADYKSDKWVMKSDKPVVIDFNATWCGPCKRLAPVLEELAQEYDGRIVFYSIDVDKNKPLAQAFQVRSIPMLLMCPVEGKPQSIVGLYPKEEMIKAFDYMFFNKEK